MKFKFTEKQARNIGWLAVIGIMLLVGISLVWYNTEHLAVLGMFLCLWASNMKVFH